MSLPACFRGVIAVPLVALALVAVGCGSSSGSASSSGSSAGNAQDAARIKLAQCLRDNGVDIPDNPGQGGGGGGAGAGQNIDRTKLQAAMTACRKYQKGAFGNVSPSQQQGFRDAFTKFSACMRQHGVEIPDVSAGNGPPAGGQQLDQSDPKTKAALQACQSKLPRGGARGGGPS